MTQGIKDNIIFGSAIFMLLFGVALTTAGFIIEPAGQVHDSVLYVLGQCLIFAGSAMGISAYTTGKLREMRHEIDRRFRAYERGESQEQEGKDGAETDTDGEEG